MSGPELPKISIPLRKRAESIDSNYGGGDMLFGDEDPFVNNSTVRRPRPNESGGGAGTVNTGAAGGPPPPPGFPGPAPLERGVALGGRNEAEVNEVNAGPGGGPLEGGRRKSRKSRKSRKTRKTRKSRKSRK